MKYLYTIFIILLGCHPDSPAPKLDPTPDVETLYVESSNRLLQMLDNGWVVSRTDNTIQHLGDSLIWSGIALSSLTCENGRQIEDALVKMIQDNHGGLYRHPSLPDQISMDGALGLYRGIAHRIVACGKATYWKSALEMHTSLDHDILNIDSDITLPPEFTYVRDLVAARATGTSDPDISRRDALTLQVAGWARAVIADKSPCFRLNLGYQALRTIEELGVPVDHDAFCEATDGSQIATIDTWCGRTGAEQWVKHFKYDEWEYAHQRCVAWETPDGNGVRTPAVDLIELLQERYKL